MNRFWLPSCMALLALAQVFTAVNSSLASDIGSEKLLPKETLAFFSISNVPELVRKWDRTSMGQMLHDPQVKPFLDEVYKKKEEWSKENVESVVGVSIDDLLQVPQGDFSIAFVKLSPGKFAVIVRLEFGKNRETIDLLLKKIDEKMEGMGKDHSVEEVDGVKLQIYSGKVNQANGFSTSEAYFINDSSFVWSSDVEALKDVLDRWDGSHDNTLVQNDEYGYIQEQCKTEGNDPLIKMYLSPIGLIQALISTSPQMGMAGAFLPVLGINGLKGYGGAFTFDDGDFEAVANFFLFVDSTEGVLKAFNFPATQLAPPHWVPETVATYAAINWDIFGAYQSIESLVDTFAGGPGTTARSLEKFSEQGPKINVKKEFLDYLDGKIHFMQAAPKVSEDDSAEAFQLMFLGFGLKDAAKMKKTLAKAAKSEDSNMVPREFNGETIYEITKDDADQTLSLAVTDGHFVVTNDTPLLEGMMRGRSGQTAPLVDSDDYKKFAKFIPSKTSMSGFQRNDLQLKAGYNHLKASLGANGEGIDWSKLPPFEVVSKYLLPSASYIVPDKKGAKTVSFTLKRSD